jgi:hypothetical protein
MKGGLCPDCFGKWPQWQVSQQNVSSLRRAWAADRSDEPSGRRLSAANALALIMGTLPEPAYRLRKLAVEQARLDAEHAREALLKHLKEHGC